MTSGNQTDAKIDDLVGYFLGELYKSWPPSQEEAEADTRTLTAQLRATIDDWVFAKYDATPTEIVVTQPLSPSAAKPAASDLESTTRAICRASGLCKYVGDKCNTSRCSVSPDAVAAALTERGERERERAAEIADCECDPRREYQFCGPRCQRQIAAAALPPDPAPETLFRMEQAYIDEVSPGDEATEIGAHAMAYVYRALRASLLSEEEPS